MIPLLLDDEILSGFPHFPIPRLLAENGAFEPRTPPLRGRTAFSKAFVDTAAPYVIIPFQMHAPGHIKRYRSLGLQPYRLASMSGPPLLQPMFEVGVQFLVRVAGGFVYRPARFAIVKAYFLEPGIRPTGRLVIGLDALRTHFPLFTDGKRAFFLEPGDTLQIP